MLGIQVSSVVSSVCRSSLLHTLLHAQLLQPPNCGLSGSIVVKLCPPQQLQACDWRTGSRSLVCRLQPASPRAVIRCHDDSCGCSATSSHVAQQAAADGGYQLHLQSTVAPILGATTSPAAAAPSAEHSHSISRPVDLSSTNCSSSARVFHASGYTCHGSDNLQHALYHTLNDSISSHHPHVHAMSASQTVLAVDTLETMTPPASNKQSSSQAICTSCCEASVPISPPATEDRLLVMQQPAETCARALSNLMQPTASDPALVLTRIHAAGICCPMEVRLIRNMLAGVPGVMEVQVTVVTKTVLVRHHPATISPASLVAALNRAGLQAHITTTDQPGMVNNSDATAHTWMPPGNVLLCGALLLLSMLGLIHGASFLTWLALAAAAAGLPPVVKRAYAALAAKTLDINTLVTIALLGATGLGQWHEAGALVFLFTLAEWLEDRCVGRAAGALTDILRLQPEAAWLLQPANKHELGDKGCDSTACCSHNHALPSSCSSDSLSNTAHDMCCSSQQSSSLQSLDQPCAAGTTVKVTCSQHINNCSDTLGHMSCSEHAATCSSTHDAQQPCAAHEHGKLECATQPADISSSARTWPVPVSAPVSHVLVGDIVWVRPGDKVPLDGVVVEGDSVVDESMLTGESRPVSKTAGCLVIGGSVNCGRAAMVVRVTAAADDSTVARLGAVMDAAAEARSPRDMAIETFVKYYTPAVVLGAVLSLLVGVVVSPGEWRSWTYMSLVVLVTACPCALVISTPVASAAGLARAARQVQKYLQGLIDGLDSHTAHISCIPAAHLCFRLCTKQDFVLG